jgi:hypothetical protein
MNLCDDFVVLGVDLIDQIVTVVAMTSMFVGGFTAAILDNTIPGAKIWCLWTFSTIITNMRILITSVTILTDSLYSSYIFFRKVRSASLPGTVFG